MPRRPRTPRTPSARCASSAATPRSLPWSSSLKGDRRRAGSPWPWSMPPGRGVCRPSCGLAVSPPTASTTGARPSRQPSPSAGWTLCWPSSRAQSPQPWEARASWRASLSFTSMQPLVRTRRWLSQRHCSVLAPQATRPRLPSTEPAPLASTTWSVSSSPTALRLSIRTRASSDRPS